MKILIVASTLAGGGLQRAVSNISLYLPKEIEIDLLLNSVSENDFPHGGNVVSLGMKPNSKMDFIYQSKVFIKRFFCLKKLKRTGNYDICLSFMESANMVNILTGGKCSVIISVRGYISSRKSFQYRYIASPMMRLLYNGADQIISISKGVEDDLIQSYGIRPGLIRTIYNVFDVDVLQRESKKKNTLFKREVDKFYFLTSGRNVPVKGQWHLIRAFSEVVKKKPEARLVILGTGELKDYYEKLIEGYQLQDKIYLLGFVNCPFQIAGQCDVFVFPSLHEGFGNALIENMACGLPVIASDFRSGAREVLAPDTDFRFEQMEKVEKAQNGLIVPVCSGKQYSCKDPLEKQEKIMCEAMCLMMQDENLREYYKQKSICRAKDFSKDAIMDNWVQILKENCR